MLGRLYVKGLECKTFFWTKLDAGNDRSDVFCWLSTPHGFHINFSFLSQMYNDWDKYRLAAKLFSSFHSAFTVILSNIKHQSCNPAILLISRCFNMLPHMHMSSCCHSELDTDTHRFTVHAERPLCAEKAEEEKRAVRHCGFAKRWSNKEQSADTAVQIKRRWRNNKSQIDKVEKRRGQDLSVSASYHFLIL